MQQGISTSSWHLHEKIQAPVALNRGCALRNSWFIEITASNPGYYRRLGQEGNGWTTIFSTQKSRRPNSRKRDSLVPWRRPVLLLLEKEGDLVSLVSFCNGVTCSVNTGGTVGKLTFGTGTQVSVIAGESSQVAPFAIPWARECLYSLPWGYQSSYGEANCGCYNELSYRGLCGRKRHHYQFWKSVFL